MALVVGTGVHEVGVGWASSRWHGGVGGARLSVGGVGGARGGCGRGWVR